MILTEHMTLPNLRKFFRPDPGYTMFDVDLAGADAQVVAWDAGDEGLKAAFRAHAAGTGPKVHCVNAKTIYGELAGPDGKREPYYSRAKAGVHLTNYGGQAVTCASALHCSLFEAQKFQDTWFRLHPEIKDWHERILHQITTTRTVRNAFGFRRIYFDRIEDVFTQALAWIPQSTVALVINKGYLNVHQNLPEAQILLQVHDSLVGQVKTSLWPSIKPKLLQQLTVPVPYADPLVIPLGLKTSTVSWGDCKDEKWAE